MNTLNAQQIVKLVDETAKCCPWGSEGYWVKGSGWETKITYSEQRAWELAVEAVASLAVRTA